MESSYATFDLEHIPKNVQQKQYQYRKHSYTICNYDSAYLCFDAKKEILRFRSVIYSHPEKQLLCYSPGKGMSSQYFCDSYSTEDKDLYFDEIIDGPMVNLFYDPRLNEWEIATKSAIGGHYRLFKKTKTKERTVKTVREMFVEAFTCAPISMTNNLSNNTILTEFPKHYAYSFVLQHPDCGFIFPLSSPKLYLVAAYKINRSTSSVSLIPPFIFQNWKMLRNLNVLFSTSKTFSNFNEISEAPYFSKSKTGNFRGFRGIHLGTGEQCMFESIHFKELIRLHSIHPQIMLQYLCLYRLHMVQDYLEQFPQFRKYFKLFKDHISQFVESIHRAYMLKYVFKEEREEVCEKYRKHISMLHMIYFIPSKGKFRVTRKTVHDYFISKPPSEFMYYLFEEKRQNDEKLLRLYEEN